MDEINTILRTSDIPRGTKIYFTEKMATQSYLVTAEFTFDGRIYVGTFKAWNKDKDGYLIAATYTLPENYEITYKVLRQTDNYTLLAH